jgi:diaminopimelate decarboxylase
MALVQIPGGQGGGAMGTAVPAAINKALAMHFPSPNTRIIGEPGRYMVQDAATIACAINGVRPRHALVCVHARRLQVCSALQQQMSS